jgi:flagellar protein FlaG
MIKVVDNETNEVIREFPPKKILDMIANMMELAGLIVDERR